jgi:hypothetical protein
VLDSLIDQPKVPLLRWHDERSFPIGQSDPDAWDDRADGLYARFTLLATVAAQTAAM